MRQLWENEKYSTLTTLASNVLEQIRKKEKVINASSNAYYNCKDLDIVFDYSRQLVTEDIMKSLLNLAETQSVAQNIERLFAGEYLNTTEHRRVCHTILREIMTNGSLSTSDQQLNTLANGMKNCFDNINQYVTSVRKGKLCGYTEKQLKNVICIGIGGSYLGTKFVHEALREVNEYKELSKGRTLNFISNIDPFDFWNCFTNLNIEETLVIVISKSFNTPETLTNAHCAKNLFFDKFGSMDCLKYHMIAVSNDVTAAQIFGIHPDRIFPIPDCIGGRFSVSSAVGCLPLSLQYGFEFFENVMRGCRAMDVHFLKCPLDQNIPVLMALLSVWNHCFLKYPNQAVIPYSSSFKEFGSYIQQIFMESNGKSVSSQLTPLKGSSCPVYICDVGTNSQHSFFQLLHEGSVVPVDFLGFAQPQNDITAQSDTLSNHDLLIINMISQADALAFGAPETSGYSSNIKETGKKPYKIDSGNRPSTVLMFNKMTAIEIGKIISLFESKAIAEGFLYGINSFDQWGVELGKQIAKSLGNSLNILRNDPAKPLPDIPENSSTFMLLKDYIKKKDKKAN